MLTIISPQKAAHNEILVKRQTDSSSCPDCAMDPQDVPYLFNCTAHPTALAPVNLWNKSVKTIQELSYLDPATRVCRKTAPNLGMS